MPPPTLNSEEPDNLGGGRQAHPRSRGENAERRRGGELLGGSSPLTRGKRHSLQPRLRDRGLIPAHAGKTEPPARGPRPPAAHPRSRGENSESSYTVSSAYGSSPLTRGKHGQA